MTPQLKLVTLGTGSTLVAKFAFGRDWQTSISIGLAAIAAVAILLAKDDK